MNTMLTGTLAIDDLPFLKDYDKLKPRLSMRLNDFRRIAPDVISQPFLDFSVTFHIDVSDVMGRESASCIMKKWMFDYLKVGKSRIFHDAIENSLEMRPAETMPIEEYLRRLGASGMEEKTGLMVATTEGLAYGAIVVMYPGFLKRISDGRNLYLIPSSVHEWLYIEDSGELEKDRLTDLLRTVNREVVEEKDYLSDDLYYYNGKGMERASAYPD